VSPAPEATPEPTPILQQQAPCYDQEGTLCAWVADRSGMQWLGTAADWFVQKPAQILLILVVAIVARAILHHAISRLATRAAEGNVPSILSRGNGKLLETAASPLLSERRRQRARTIASLLKSITTGVILSIAFITILAELGVNIAPLLASAGIVGVALGFGAQSLVKDFISGIFMVLEDQYGVGDAIDMGEAKGVVESVGLRVTRLRALDGSVWYVRNGEVVRVGNNGQGWARAVIDVPIAYDEDVERVRELLLRTATEVVDEEPYREMVLEPPEVWGVETLSPDAVVVRLVVKTQPLKKDDVARALRQRIKAAFDEHRVERPVTRNTLVLENPETVDSPSRTANTSSPSEPPRGPA
jgi:moderate conductance mechanosensitive channel